MAGLCGAAAACGADERRPGLRHNAGMFHVVLHQPEIPANTGNIIRLCANSGCRLHLIEPLGFRLDRPSVRRAALDYAELTVLQTHASLPAFAHWLRTSSPEARAARCFAIETGSGPDYTEAAFQAGDVLLFGSETRGLPAAALPGLPEAQRLQIPMRAGNRSLNLSNCVALVVYEAWRQNRFAGAGTGTLAVTGADVPVPAARAAAPGAGRAAGASGPTPASAGRTPV